MAFMGSCHHHTSSSPSMATAPRFGARKPAPASMSFTTSAAHAHGHGHNPSRLSFSAPTNSKVFEDQARGIVCYRDVKGELVCEGYDEGPRLPEKPCPCFQWPVAVGVQVTDFIHLATLRVFEDDDVLRRKDDRRRHRSGRSDL